MGFFDRFKKNDSKKNGKSNFDYLDNLIHSGQKEIFLDSDIVFNKRDKSNYSDGILLNVDDIIIDGQGHTIDAKNKIPIFKCSGKNIILKNITFKNGFSNGVGGALVNSVNSSLKIIKCNFINNASNGGGGAIANNKDSILTIQDTNFKKNSSNSGGAIFNEGTIDMDACEFSNNSAYLGGAIGNNTGSILNSTTTKFINNQAKADGGAIVNIGELSLDDCEFAGNHAKEYADVISNQHLAILNINNVDFINHNVNYALLYNKGILNLDGGTFKDNRSKKDVQLIFSEPGSSLSCSDYKFINNIFAKGTCVNNNSSDAKFVKCSFFNNKNNSLIFNWNSLNFIDCIFSNNDSNFFIIDSFDEKSSLSLIGGKFDNNNSRTTIYTGGKSCTVEKTIFKDNFSSNKPLNNFYNESFFDICNESYLGLKEPKFESIKTVLNKGQLDIRKFSKTDVEKFIENRGCIDFYDDIPQEENYDDSFDFSYLDYLIHFDSSVGDFDSSGANSENIIENGIEKVLITLKSSISSKNYERDFFEGGIDLDIDNLIIDGNNNVIDGNEKFRIFNVSGKNIILKNIIFKNAKVLIGNSQQEHLSGGGAIKIVKGASLKLINCKFINSYSEDIGGAIFNNGELNSIKCCFNNNESKYYGGAIYNKGLVHIENNEFKENKSKFAGAIYNLGNLTIENIILKDNVSNISQSIYNANLINMGSELNVNDEIYDVVNVNPVENVIYKSFIYLEDQIINSNNVILKEDVVFDYKKDYKLKKGIDINNELIIDGKGHSIDGNYISSFFNVNAKVTFKDLTFKNGFSLSNNIINNDALIVFKNCKFLNNRITSNNYLVNNNGSLTFENCSFYNNLSKNILLFNKGNLELNEIIFINNNFYAENGKIIGNEKSNKVKIINSIFKFNTSRSQLIFNNGESIAQDVEFKNNESKNHELILNRGIINLNKVIFDNNYSNNGIITNNDFGVMNIKNSVFNQNISRICGAIINSGMLNLNNAEFTGNVAKLKGGAGAIFLTQGEFKKENCIFKNNSPKDIVREMHRF